MKLLMVDKDGTLVKTRSGERFPNSPWDQQPIDGVERELLSLEVAGWTIVIISNQGGVSAGHWKRRSLKCAIALNCFR